MKKVFVLLLFFLNTGSFAQKMTIITKDAVNGNTLPFCHLCYEAIHSDSVFYELSNDKGSFTINFTEAFVLSVSYVGYEPFIDTIFEWEENKIIKLNPGLHLNEVIVTGHSKPVPRDQSIYKVDVIGSHQINQSNANTMVDILERQSNIRINHDASTGSSLEMQGITGENVKILIDGVPVIGRLDGNIDLSQISLNNVEHIEIIEGPMSVIYGSNALGGVVNIITKENKYANYRSDIEAYYESVGIYNLNTSAYFKRKHNNLGIQLGRNFFDGFDTIPESRSQTWKPKEQYNVSLFYKYDKNKFDFKFKSDLFKERLVNKSDPVGTYKTIVWDSWFHTLRINNSLDASRDYGKAGRLDFLGSWSWYSRERNKYRKDLTTLNQELSTEASDHDTTQFNAFVIRSVYSYASENEKLNLQAGFDLNHETAHGKRIQNGSKDQGDYAAFATIQYIPLNGLNLQPGFRYAYNTNYNAPIVPSLNIKYGIKKNTIRLSYARGFRAPSLKELHLFFFDSNHQIEGNENLEAETSHNFNASYSHSFRLFNSNAEYSISGYYNNITNKIQLVQVDPENPIYFKNENIGQLKTTGGKAHFTFSPISEINLDMSYSRGGIMKNQDNPEMVWSSDFSSKMMIYLLNRSVNILCSYKFYGKKPYFTYIDGEQVLAIRENYHNMDINISRRFLKNQLSISTGVKNLFNNTTIAGVSTGGAHSGGSSTDIGWGRSFFLTLKYNFVKHD
jgi:outer membrane receptor for ferrienterochelin and colicins